ncbi:MAG: hypothetical protein WDZ28_03735 [Simkaniaceae bacterium]
MRKKVLKAVLITHAFLLVLSFIFYRPLFSPRKPTKLKVKTLVLAPPPPPKIVVKSERKVQAVRKKPVLKKKPSPKRKEAQKLMASIEKSLQTIEAKNEMATSPIDLPQKITTLQIDQTPKKELNYSERLLGYLQSTLILPEIGDVKVKITINKRGGLENLEILSSESQKNENYLKEALSRENFPSMIQKKSKSFILTFCHKEAA